MQSDKKPHRIPRLGGDVFVSHQEYIEYLYDCVQAWENRGERHQANLIRRQIMKAKRNGEKRCAVCTRARMSPL